MNAYIVAAMFFSLAVIIAVLGFHAGRKTSKSPGVSVMHNLAQVHIGEMGEVERDALLRAIRANPGEWLQEPTCSRFQIIGVYRDSTKGLVYQCAQSYGPAPKVGDVLESFLGAR